ncbi:MAG: M50 family metallopeptidase [Chloroflexota bacterium]
MTIQLIFEFVVGIALIIIVHELGHFIACRLLNVEVEEFGLGLPPRAVTLFEAQGTKFTLNWLPLGGFVRPKGENDPDVEGGLAAAPAWVRIVVYAAGGFMNIVTAILLFALIISIIGKPDPARLDVVEITSVAAGSPAEAAGIQPQDILVSINGQAMTSAEAVQEVIGANLGQEITIVYGRGEQRYEATAVPRTEPPPNQGALGIVMGTPTVQVGVFESLQGGVQAIGAYIRALSGMLGRLVSGQASPGEARVVGFKGMYDMYRTVRVDAPLPGLPPIVDTLNFFASLSVWLGLINLVPIPALDGGRILLILPELIFRRRVPAKVEAVMIGVSFLILIALMLFVNLRDFITPAQIP